MALRRLLRHSRCIEPIAPTFSARHASTIAVAVLTVSISAAVATVWIDRTGAAAGRLLNDPLTTTSELLCFGAGGAVLLARRPDLPFGWILALGALGDVVLVGVGVPSLALTDHGHGGELPVWGVGVSVLQWLGVALEGLINVRFPSGRPSGRVGLWLDRALRYGIPLGLIGNYLGDSGTSDLAPPLRTHRFIDGTWVTPLGNASLVLIPVLILLGLVAGIRVVVRFTRATGIERKQLQWRATGVVMSLALFPLAVADLLDGAFVALEPLVLVSTLIVPVFRYQLWQGDPGPRRRRLGPLVSRRTLIEAREEERRRLRRDLHDGLGPLLTGLRLNLDAVQAQLATNPEKALEHLLTARAASADVIDDLRGLVYGLRPPALDELGLAGSLRVHLASLVADSPINLTVETEDDLVVPAAVEVALYRTAAEAVTNVVRHSAGSVCRVSIATDGADVLLTVDDNGGVTDTWHAGVGLTSMRERAIELGGTFSASSGPSGFHVRVVYPRR